MTVTAVQRAVLPGIPAGYEAAFGQVWYNYAAARLTAAAPELVAMDCNIGIKGEGFEYIFGRGKGLVSIRYNGVQLLDDTVRPNFWRAPTNNDEGCAEPFTFAFWKTAGLYARCDNLTAETKGDFVIARANYTLPDGQTLPIDFAIDGAGRWKCTLHITIPEISVTIGIMFIMAVGGMLNAGYDQILLLQQPANNQISQVLDTYIIQTGIRYGKFEYATAIGLFKSVFSLIMVAGTNYLTQKYAEVGLW